MKCFPKAKDTFDSSTIDFCTKALNKIVERDLRIFFILRFFFKNHAAELFVIDNTVFVGVVQREEFVQILNQQVKFFLDGDFGFLG